MLEKNRRHVPGLGDAFDRDAGFALVIAAPLTVRSGCSLSAMGGVGRSSFPG